MRGWNNSGRAVWMTAGERERDEANASFNKYSKLCIHEILKHTPRWCCIEGIIIRVSIWYTCKPCKWDAGVIVLWYCVVPDTKLCSKNFIYLNNFLKAIFYHKSVFVIKWDFWIFDTCRLRFDTIVLFRNHIKILSIFLS